MFWRIWKVFGREQLQLTDTVVNIGTVKDKLFILGKASSLQAWTDPLRAQKSWGSHNF